MPFEDTPLNLRPETGPSSGNGLLEVNQRIHEEVLAELDAILSAPEKPIWFEVIKVWKANNPPDPNSRLMKHWRKIDRDRAADEKWNQVRQVRYANEIAADEGRVVRPYEKLSDLKPDQKAERKRIRAAERKRKSRALAKSRGTI